MQSISRLTIGIFALCGLNFAQMGLWALVWLSALVIVAVIGAEIYRRRTDQESKDADGPPPPNPLKGA